MSDNDDLVLDTGPISEDEVPVEEIDLPEPEDEDQVLPEAEIPEMVPKGTREVPYRLPDDWTPSEGAIPGQLGVDKFVKEGGPPVHPDALDIPVLGEEERLTYEEYQTEHADDLEETQEGREVHVPDVEEEDEDGSDDVE